ncbi:MAG: RecX family transcriptional regulator, partial [Eubacterium sp.]
YLESAIRTNLMGNQFGRLRLKQDLARRGIKGELLNQLEVFYPVESEEECCRNQMQKAIKKYAGEFGRKKLQKVGAYLQRRGFSYDMINTMIGDIPLETSKDMTEKRQSDIEGYFEKYRRMQERKGYSGWELNQRIKRNLASRGFSFDEINAVMNREDEFN